MKGLKMNLKGHSMIKYDLSMASISIIVHVSLPELVPEGRSVSGYVTTHNNRPGHNSDHSQQTKFYVIGETIKAYRLPFK